MPIRGDNILDLVLASHDHLVHNLSAALPFSTIDHNSVLFDLKGITEYPKLRVPSVVKQQLDFSKCDLVALTTDLNLVDWSLIFSPADTIDDAWLQFSSKFSMLIDKNTPFKTVKLVGSRTSTLPFRILKITRLKKTAWKKFVRTHFRLDYLTFKKLASQFRTEVR